MRIWMKDGCEQEISRMKDDGLFENPYLEASIALVINPGSVWKYIDLDVDPFNPATELPHLLNHMIRKVTIDKYRIYRGLRTDGVYLFEGAKLLAETVDVVRGARDGIPFVRGLREVWQNLSIRAIGFDALKAIYSRFRQGLLTPVLDYEAEPLARLLPSKLSEVAENDPLDLNEH